MLAKRGNSGSKAQIELVERFIKLFGKECIESLVADREFVGKKWITFLNENQIQYHLRIRNNFYVFLPDKSKSADAEVKVFWLFNWLKTNEFIYFHKLVRIKKVDAAELCYLSGCRTKDDFLIIVSFNNPKMLNMNTSSAGK